MKRAVCRLCRTGARGFDAAYCFGAYEGTLRELIHLFKYGRMKPLAKPLARIWQLRCRAISGFDVVVPMPLHWRRKWQRGFNQSELLARATARRCGIPMVNAVRRTRATAAQAGLSNAGRRENVAGAFRVRKPRRRRGTARSAGRRCDDHRRHRQRLCCARSSARERNR